MKDTKESHVLAQYVLIIATTEEPVGHKNIWLKKLVVCILHLGML